MFCLFHEISIFIHGSNVILTFNQESNYWKLCKSEQQRNSNCENDMISMSRAWDKENIWVPDKILNARDMLIISFSHLSHQA